MKKKLYLIGSTLTIALLIAIDQISKYLVVQHLKPIRYYELCTGILRLTYLENRGAFFGMLQGARWFFIILTMICLLVCGYLFIKMPIKSRYLPLRSTLIIFTAGAIGNFIDRFINGYVVDFFEFRFINFAVFNVADIYVTISFVLIILLILFKYKDKDFEVFKRSTHNE